MLTPEGNQIPDRWEVATLNVCSEKLPALTKAQCIDGRGSPEDIVSGQLGADVLDLLGQVAEEGSAAVRVAGIAYLDDVDVCSRVDGFGDSGCLFDAVRVVGVAKAVPDYEGEWCKIETWR